MGILLISVLLTIKEERTDVNLNFPMNSWASVVYYYEDFKKIFIVLGERMFQIISDGSCDFTADEVKNSQIGIVPFYITFDETTYLKEGVDITKDAYFTRLKQEKDTFPKTSQPSPQDYFDVYSEALKAGKDVLVITLSSKLSGSNNSARIAADMAKDEYPNNQVIVLDSLNATIAQGLVLRELIKMREAGLSLSGAADKGQQIIDSTQIFFTPETLEYLKRGGRISSSKAAIGNALGIRPILTVVEGAASQLGKARGQNKALKIILETLVEAVSDTKDRLSFQVGHIVNEEAAIAFKETVEQTLGIKINTPIGAVGATIGTHIGPGAVAVAYCKKYDTL